MTLTSCLYTHDNYLDDDNENDDDDDANSGDQCTRNKVAIGDRKAAPGWKQNTKFQQKYKYTNPIETNKYEWLNSKKYKTVKVYVWVQPQTQFLTLVKI